MKAGKQDREIKIAMQQNGSTDTKFSIEWHLSHYIEITFEISEVEERRKSKGRRLSGSAPV